VKCATGYTVLGFTGVTPVATDTALTWTNGAGGLWGCYPCGSNVDSCVVPVSTTSAGSGLTINTLICTTGYF